MDILYLVWNIADPWKNRCQHQSVSWSSRSEDRRRRETVREGGRWREGWVSAEDIRFQPPPSTFHQQRKKKSPQTINPQIPQALCERRWTAPQLNFAARKVRFNRFMWKCKRFWRASQAAPPRSIAFMAHLQPPALQSFLLSRTDCCRKVRPECSLRAGRVFMNTVINQSEKTSKEKSRSEEDVEAMLD